MSHFAKRSVMFFTKLSFFFTVNLLYPLCASATFSCHDFFVKEDLVALEKEAASLFILGEKELAYDALFRGNGRRLINAKVGADLLSVIARLKREPGDHQQFIPTLNELASVLIGHMEAYKYSRRAHVGVAELEVSPVEFSENAPFSMTTLHGKYKRFVLKNVFFKKDISITKFPLNPVVLATYPTELDMHKALMENQMGEGASVREGSSVEPGSTLHKFSVLSRFPEDSLRVYLIEGIKITNDSTGEVSTFVDSLKGVTNLEQRSYFYAMALEKNVRSRTVALPEHIFGFRAVYIPAHVVVKLEAKHKIPIDELVEFLVLAKFTRIFPIHDRLFYYYGLATRNDKTLRFVFDKNSKVSGELVLRTAYKEDIAPE